MKSEPIAVIVLAAGLGSRMKSERPKVMHAIAGRPMVCHLLAAVEALAPARVTVVAGPGMAALEDAVAPRTIVVQSERLGTGHAVMAAADSLAGFTGSVLVVYGDSPLLSTATMRSLIEARLGGPDAGLAVLGFRPQDPGAYGRLVEDNAGRIARIVEAKDASPGELAIGLCNSGVMAIDGARMAGWLARIGNDNAKGEYYLTDIVAIAAADGAACAVVEADETETLGVNSRLELAQAERIAQDQLRLAALDGGATLLDPGSVYFSYDTRLGRDVEVGQNVVFGPGVRVGDNVTIRPFCHIEGAAIADGAIVGPYARLRPGADIGAGAHIGNFVEVKNATVEPGAKANHLSYIGDARVGEGANIGAGTITCNYDGFDKGHTDIGAGAFIGSNTALVAPVKIGDGAIVGAGSVLSKDVPADALAVTRGPRNIVEGWAKKFRTGKQKTNKDKP